MDPQNTVLLQEAQFARMANYIQALNKKLDTPTEKCLVNVTIEIESITFSDESPQNN